MSYRVRIRVEAEQQITEGFRYLSERSPSAAEEWLADIMAAIVSLRDFPVRCPVAPEQHAGKSEMRQLLCRTHHIRFVVVADEVSVVHVRHTARAPDTEL